MAATGVPVDFDDDGFAEYQRTKQGDGSELVEMFTPSGAVYFQAEYYPDGSYVIRQDVNRDEMTDIQETFSVNPPRKERLYDKDFDGYPEERVRVEFDVPNSSVTVFYERDDDGDGNYVVTYEKTEVIEVPSKSRMLRSDEEDKYLIVVGPIKIYWKNCADDKDAAYENGLKIFRATVCALGHGKDCMKTINSALFRKMIGFIENQKNIKINCEFPKENSSNAVAWADTYAGDLAKVFGDYLTWVSDAPSIHFNPRELNGLLGCSASATTCISQSEPDKLCNIFLHEFLHHVDGITPEKSHDDGTDEVYSCARYCSGCAQNLKGATGDPHADCLRCSGSLEERLTCGYKEIILENNCRETLGDLGVCHAGLACISGSCEKCKILFTKTCDYEILKEIPYTAEVQNFLFCSKCPESCSNSNDFPCNGFYQTENTCHDPLPLCSRQY